MLAFFKKQVSGISFKFMFIIREPNARPNARNILNATYIAQYCCAQHFGHVWPPCCSMLDGVGSSLKIFKFVVKHFWMLHDVALVWPHAH